MFTSFRKVVHDYMLLKFQLGQERSPHISVIIMTKHDQSLLGNNTNQAKTRSQTKFSRPQKVRWEHLSIIIIFYSSLHRNTIISRICRPYSFFSFRFKNKGSGKYLLEKCHKKSGSQSTIVNLLGRQLIRPCVLKTF